MPTKVKPDKIKALRLKNLERANAVRLRNAELRRDLTRMSQVEACRLVADRLVNDPGILEKFSLEKLLTSINGVGLVRAERIAGAAERRFAAVHGIEPRDMVSWSETVGDMSQSRRDELARALEQYAGVVESWNGGGRGAKAA